MFSGLSGFIENVGSIYLQAETIRAGGNTNTGGVANTADDYDRVVTGVNSDGSTLWSRESLPGVSNGKLALAIVGLIGAAGLLYVVAK